MNINLKNLLEQNHKGKSNAIKSFQLERLTNQTGSQIRECVNELRCSGVPVCSDRSGYYIAASREELNHTIAQLNSRILQINKAIKGLQSKLEDYHE